MDKSQTAVEVFNKRAKEYQDKFMNVDLYSATFDLFCKCITEKNADILEIACGPGNITSYLLKKRPDFKILATDLSVKMLELAKINNPGATFKIMDCRKINQFVQKYDGIVCGFGLPYLSKQEAKNLITDASHLLKPKGLLYLSTMEDDNEKSGIVLSSYGDKAFINYHQADYLTSYLEENNFKIIDLQRKDFTGSDGKKGTDLILIAEIR